MNKPEALRPGSALWLAQVLDAYSTAPHHKQAAAELRRLHTENEALLEALKNIERSTYDAGTAALARAAIAKTEGNT